MLVGFKKVGIIMGNIYHSQLKNGMRYQTVLEQVTLQSLKGTFRE